MDKRKEDWLELLEYFTSRSLVLSSQPVDVSFVQDTKQDNYAMKIILIGDGSVGKTSIREQYLGFGFKSQYLPTLGADFASKDENIGVKGIKFQIWDLAGQTSFETLRTLYYRGATGAFVVCDVSDRESVKNINNWINELWKNNGKGPIPFVILGNKTDLRDTGVKCFEDQELQEIITELSEMTKANFKFSISYIPTSAKTGENITKAFKQMALQVILHRKYLKQHIQKNEKNSF